MPIYEKFQKMMSFQSIFEGHERRESVRVSVAYDVAAIDTTAPGWFTDGEGALEKNLIRNYMT